MSRRSRLLAAVVVPVLAPVVGLTLGAASATADVTNPPEQLALIDGPASPEDIVTLPGSEQVLVTGMAADALDAEATGHLYLVNSRTKARTEIWPERAWSVDWNKDTYPSCPGAPDPTKASPHGINVEVRRDGGWTVLAVNHGGREAIEVFHLDEAKTPNLTWEGCVPLPEGTFGNGVAPLGDGFVVTDFFDPTRSQPFDQIFSDEPPTGSLLRWKPAQGWSEVPGSQMYGPNGVEVSSDGRTAYVAEWGKSALHRLPLTDEPHRWERAASVQLPYLPDNVRWDRNGRLLVTGQDFTPQQVAACQADDLDNCPTGLVAHAVDPHRMVAKEIINVQNTDFRAPTVVEDVGNTWWVGTVKGEQIGVVHQRGHRSR